MKTTSKTKRTSKIKKTSKVKMIFKMKTTSRCIVHYLKKLLMTPHLDRQRHSTTDPKQEMLSNRIWKKCTQHWACTLVQTTKPYICLHIWVFEHLQFSSNKDQCDSTFHLHPFLLLALLAFWKRPSSSNPIVLS